MSKKVRGFFTALLLTALLGLAGCTTTTQSPDVKINDTKPQLRAGDRIRISVFGDEDLSGEYDINASGALPLPLIGTITAQGQTITAFQTTLTQLLGEGYIVDPKVSVELVSLRPFYILGEVNTPGSYPSLPEMDVFKAIATAGGLTPRAVNGRYIIYRGFGDNRHEISASDETPIMPGDSIRVKQRFF